MRTRDIKRGVIPAGTVVWKKVIVQNRCGYGGCTLIECGNILGIAKLLVVEAGVIPKFNNNGKCRVKAAYVLSIVQDDGTFVNSANSWHTPTFKYNVGQVVKPTAEFNSDRLEICTSGIHCFLTEKEAREYKF